MATSLLELLSSHLPADQKERTELEYVRRAAAQLPSPFSRAAPIHFTASAVVITPDGERVCLVHHRKALRWLQPGGHVEPCDGGSLVSAALREAREEMGSQVRLHGNHSGVLHVDRHRVPGLGQEPAHFHLDVCFLAVALNPEALSHDPEESLGAIWLPWEEALARADGASISRLLGKARALVANGS